MRNKALARSDIRFACDITLCVVIYRAVRGVIYGFAAYRGAAEPQNDECLRHGASRAKFGCAELNLPLRAS